MSQPPVAARHTVVLLASLGQAAPEPVQVSAASHTPAALRQTVLEATKLSAGHVLLPPVHVSATSHTPAAARHTAVLFASAGQAAPDPVQLSARSHTPAALRQTVLDETKPSAAHVLLLPSQVSATSH